MPSKPSSNRKSPTRKPAAPVRARQTTQRKAAASTLAEDEDDDDEEQSALVQRASALRETARQHEGSVVVTALVTGFSLGLFLGGLLVHSKMRGHWPDWPDRNSLQATGRRLLNQVESHIPESIRDKVGLG
jgi:hypothetical protein